MSAKNKLTRREDIPAAAKWHLSDIYATRDAWKTARDSITGQLDSIERICFDHRIMSHVGKNQPVANHKRLIERKLTSHVPGWRLNTLSR